ncbi:tetratricopeptide repeat protein [Cyanobacteria bacterium 150NLHA]|uniref:class I SAM-dependent methyltransferase n=1 Tax=Prochlorococcus sp. P1361 TaxID=2729589 RepID=UPI00145F024E|nr:class I SAM-dependent methyltransferase [Prochlorococcus sp. P1361]NMP05999.1 tetratricopeptide repeat protein [Prochlorococcus sp. P1361]
MSLFWNQCILIIIWLLNRVADLRTIKQLSADGHHQECIQACQEAFQVEPEQAIAYKYAGKSFLALGQIEQAQKLLIKSHQLDKSDPETTKDIGNSYLQLQDIANARKWYQASLVINKDYAPAINNIANLDSQSGNHNSALELFKQAIAADPNLFPALLGAASSAIALNQPDKAIAFAINALEISPNTLKAHELLGIAYQNTGQQEKAIEHYKKEISRNSAASASMVNLGVILLQRKEAAESIKLLKQASVIAPNEQISLLLAQAYQNQQQWSDAISEYEKLNLGAAHNKLIPYNYGLCLIEAGVSDKAIAAFETALKLDKDFVEAWGNIGVIHKREGRLKEALEATQTALLLEPNNAVAHMNLGSIYKELGNLEEALEATLKTLELKSDNADAYITLGNIYKEIGKHDEALEATLKSLSIKPDNADAYINLGNIYKEIGKHDEALEATLKSLELKADNEKAYINLGAIYKDLGDTRRALEHTLKSLELKPDNALAINNLNKFSREAIVGQENAAILTQAYAILLNNKNIFHDKLSKIFVYRFLPGCQAALGSDPIISANNTKLKELLTDHQFIKSLTLLIAPHPYIEFFLTRIRKELLMHASKRNTIPDHLKPFSNALATQCFLNEYAYAQSSEEENYVNKLILRARHKKEEFDQYLSVIACYVPIHELEFQREWLNSYLTLNEESNLLIKIQFEEPLQEEELKNSLRSFSTISDAVSVEVKAMYEKNPYPRYRFAQFTCKEIAKNISTYIKEESSKQKLIFAKELTTSNSNPKVLIAGCGTGQQIIHASRYKNAKIIAIDLSSKSLAYAMRKTEEYGIQNVDFRIMDILDISKLGKKFDIIECKGVLHHMSEPQQGLLALINNLKPGGYVKLGLYSELARQPVVQARNQIKRLNIKSTPEGIRDFRHQVLQGNIEGLFEIAQWARDFYSLSECRDMCFHVQEHRFTTESLQALLNNHGLIFCGFILPGSILKAYKEQFPDDSDITSLKNWGKFEKQRPTTFSETYQFWAYKPS